jgi:tetratricopeptide (TPR) repeat protein
LRRLKPAWGSSSRLWAYWRSEESYRDSIELRSSAQHNPYAFVGLAATLRRLGRYDEAHDMVKKANRHYPDDKYVVKTLSAILADIRGDREGTSA